MDTDDEQRSAVEKRLHDEGIETVLCVVPDLWGRLMGKRVTTDSFLKTALRSEGLHASLYLFVVDMDMDPRPGYERPLTPRGPAWAGRCPGTGPPGCTPRSLR